MCTMLGATARHQTTDPDGTSRVSSITLTLSQGGQRHTRGASAASRRILPLRQRKKLREMKMYSSCKLQRGKQVTCRGRGALVEATEHHVRSLDSGWRLTTQLTRALARCLEDVPFYQLEATSILQVWDRS